MKISVVVPVYNGENYICGIINDLHAQKEKSAEFIIVDDGSLDNTYRVVKNLIKSLNDERFTIIKKSNGGVSSARNVGIGNSNGKYIYFADADDRMSLNLLNHFISVIEKNNTDFEFFPFQKVIIKDNKIIKKKTKLDYSKSASNKILEKKELLKLFFFYRLQGYPFGFISKKKFWSSESFNECVSLGEDLLAILTIILNTPEVTAHINNIKEYYYVARKDSAINSVDLENLEGFEYVLREIKKNCRLDYQKKMVRNLYFGWYTECYKLALKEKNRDKATIYKEKMKRIFFRTPMPLLSRLHRSIIMLNCKM